MHPTQTLYSGSDSVDIVARHGHNSYVDGIRQCPEVKTKRANALGIYDMSGNVLEWCSNRSFLYEDPPQHLTDPVGPMEDIWADEDPRLCRGGAYSNNMNWNKVYARQFYPMTTTLVNIGFRLVVSLND
jgi:formylglycine-generating enzyme required for sulfatase activity